MVLSGEKGGTDSPEGGVKFMIERHRDDAVDMTAEVRVRLYQPSSEPLEVEQIQALVGRAVEMFLL